jgi:hypothetical protein
LIWLKESPTVEINPSKRILKLPGALCGGISTGTDKIRSGYGNGDCLYFDFKHLVFAVADGSERFPWASRDLLNRLSERLAQSGVPDTVSGWRDLINTQIYSGQKYQHKTTFSCVAIRPEGQGVCLIISHGGDSAVTVMNSVTGKISQQTGRDMNFAGRSKDIVDVTEYRTEDRDIRVLLSTDGFDDVWRFCMRQSLLGGARDVFERHPVDCICEMISGILEENRGRFEYDDIGFIIIDPYRTERIGAAAVIMGGTRPYEEQKYLSEYVSGSNDRWVTDGQWGDHDDVFTWAGIQVLVQ